MGKTGKSKGSKGAAASKAEQKAQKKAKLAAKAERKEAKKTGQDDGKKSKGKGKAGAGKSANDMDEEDLIKTLDEYRAQWEADHKVSEEIVDVPTRRANATLTACPVNSNHLWLYGGELFDGTSAFFYPDLYRYAIDKQEWRRFSSPTQPSPRSAHQMVPSPQGGGKLILFGGEYSSVNQTSFHHYRDLWTYDIANKAWERLDTKVKPSARSGHRMALWKHYVILFGGFHDVGIRTSYLGDLWIWDTQEYRWHEVQIRDTDRKPSPRSGFSFLPCPEGVIIHGGYCKEYTGKQVKGVVLDDTWLLRMDTDLSKLKWERRKKVGYAPSPRSGVQMAYWTAKAMGVSFGGVFDSYDDDEDLISTFYNELYGYQTAGNGRWISLNLKRPKKKGPTKKKKAIKAIQAQQEEAREQAEDSEGEGEEDRDEGADEKERTNGDGQHQLEGETSQPTNGAQTPPAEPDEEEEDPDDPLKTVPIARYNAMMAVQKNTLYIYGGIVESANKEFTLDDFYSLQLDKLDRFACHKECNIAELDWKESDSEDDGSGSDSDSESESSSESEAEPEEEAAPQAEEAAEAEPTDAEKADLRAKATAFMGVAKNTERDPEELMSTPLPGETLKTFYDRTREYWAQKAHEHSDNRGKSLRRDGFQLADDKYQTYKPILEEIERIQAEAGLEDDDVVNKSGGKASGLGVDSRNRR